MGDEVNLYRKAEQQMQAIIDRHMSEAFVEIKREYGTTPISVEISIVHHQEMGSEYADGVYTGCEVKMDGE